MTVAELFERCKVQSVLKVMSGYNGKVLCHNFYPQKHKEIGDRQVSCVWADIVVREDGFGHYAKPIMCVYVNGLKEMEEDSRETAPF